MKKTGTSHWTAPNTGATNSSGFTGLPGGYRYDSGEFYDIPIFGYWWSSTESSAAKAMYRYLKYDDGVLYIDNYKKLLGFSVRCLRD